MPHFGSRVIGKTAFLAEKQFESVTSAGTFGSRVVDVPAPAEPEAPAPAPPPAPEVEVAPIPAPAPAPANVIEKLKAKNAGKK